MPILGKEITKRCGNEGRHKDLKKSGETTLRFLQTAISFVPDAIKDGADLTNAAFIFAQPGREFVIKSGNGDWEFYFSEDDSDEILGRCVRTGRRQFVQKVCNFLGGASSPPLLEIKEKGEEKDVRTGRRQFVQKVWNFLCGASSPPLLEINEKGEEKI